jgi:hypothetical protein
MHLLFKSLGYTEDQHMQREIRGLGSAPAALPATGAFIVEDALYKAMKMYDHRIDKLTNRLHATQDDVQLALVHDAFPEAEQGTPLAGALAEVKSLIKAQLLKADKGRGYKHNMEFFEGLIKTYKNKAYPGSLLTAEINVLAFMQARIRIRLLKIRARRTRLGRFENLRRRWIRRHLVHLVRLKLRVVMSSLLCRIVGARQRKPVVANSLVGRRRIMYMTSRVRTGMTARFCRNLAGASISTQRSSLKLLRRPKAKMAVPGAGSRRHLWQCRVRWGILSRPCPWRASSCVLRTRRLKFLQLHLVLCRCCSVLRSGLLLGA